jgi:hypothetical protein
VDPTLTAAVVGFGGAVVGGALTALIQAASTRRVTAAAQQHADQLAAATHRHEWRLANANRINGERMRAYTDAIEHTRLISAYTLMKAAEHGTLLQLAPAPPPPPSPADLHRTSSLLRLLAPVAVAVAWKEFERAWELLQYVGNTISCPPGQPNPAYDAVNGNAVTNVLTSANTVVTELRRAVGVDDE